MTVYVLMETDTDEAYPIVSAYADLEQAILIAKADIRGNRNEIIEVDEKDQRYSGRDVWSCLHRNPLDGKEHWSTVTRLEV